MQRLPNYRSRGHIRPSGAEQQTEVEQEEQEGSDPPTLGVKKWIIKQNTVYRSM
jgi:hypothetical protein